MDWATFLKDYQVIITVISGLLLAVLGFFLNRWNSDRNRKLDKHAVIWDKKIQEAREYVDTLFDLLYLQRQLVNKLINSYGIATSGREVILETTKQVSALWGKANKQIVSIKILNDDELTSLQAKIVENAARDADYVVTVTGGVLDGSYKSFDKERLKRLADMFRDAELKIADMKVRLDKLAQTVK